MCSCALHLCPSSVLPAVAIALARSTDVLVVLSPHKRPELRAERGWERAYSAYDVGGRVRVTGWSRSSHFCV